MCVTQRRKEFRSESQASTRLRSAAQAMDVIMALAKSAKDSEADDDDEELFGEVENPQLSKQEIHHAQLNQPQNRGDTAQARHPLNL